MAKIDITKIEGYADMTAEQKLAALEALDLPDPDYTGWVKKDVADKYASEAAGYKKQLREHMSEEEAAKVKAAEDFAALQEKVKQLETEKAINENAAKFVELGYGQKLAQDTATALNNGELDAVFKNHAMFLAEREKALRAEILKETPAPPAGNGSKTLSKDDFLKMTLLEKQKFAAEHPEQYQEFYKGD